MNRYFPELVAPLGEALPERCVVDGEIVIVGARGLDFEALLLRIHPAESRVKLLADADRRPRSWRGTCSRSATRTCATCRSPSGARGSRSCSASRRAPVHLSPGDARPRAGRGLVPPLRGRGARRRDGEAARRAVPPGRAHDDQGQAPAHRRLRGRRLPLAQEWRGHVRRLAAARPLRRHAERCTTSASPPRSPTRCASELVEELAPLREDALEDHPWRDWAVAQIGSERQGTAPAGRDQPLESRQGSELGAAASRSACARSRYDHMQGDRFRHAAQFVRWRPDKPPQRLPLRSARGHARLRAGARLRGAGRARRAGCVGEPQRAVRVAACGEPDAHGGGRKPRHGS